MKIETKDGPAMVSKVSPASAARERAMAAFMGQQNNAPQQPQTAPVQNPSNVSPEEFTAVRPQSGQTDNNSNTLEVTNPSSAPVEAPQAATPPTPTEQQPASDPLSTQYAQLAKKEKALRAKAQAQEAAVKAREAELAAREEALRAKENEYQSNYVPKSRLKSDALSVLTEEGVPLESLLTPQIPQDPRVIAEIEKLKAEVQATKKLHEQARQEMTQQQQQAYQEAVRQIRNEANQLVKNDPAFEAIKATNSINDVVELIEKTYKQDGILLTVEEAAREVEDYLVDRLSKYAQLNKIKSKLAPAVPKAAAPAPKPQVDNKTQQQQPTMKTLTNSVNASKKLSARERAIAAFKGELK